MPIQLHVEPGQVPRPHRRNPSPKRFVNTSRLIAGDRDALEHRDSGWGKVVDQVLSAIIPRHRENPETAAAARPPAPSSLAPEPPPAMLGAWTGFVQTYRGTAPLVLDISASGELVAELGAEPEVRRAHPRFGEGVVRWTMPGSLGVEGEPFDLATRLYLHGGMAGRRFDAEAFVGRSGYDPTCAIGKYVLGSAASVDQSGACIMYRLARASCRAALSKGGYVLSGLAEDGAGWSAGWFQLSASFRQMLNHVSLGEPSVESVVCRTNGGQITRMAAQSPLQRFSPRAVRVQASLGRLDVLKRRTSQHMGQ